MKLSMAELPVEQGLSRDSIYTSHVSRFLIGLQVILVRFFSIVNESELQHGPDNVPGLIPYGLDSMYSHVLGMQMSSFA